MNCMKCRISRPLPAFLRAGAGLALLSTVVCDSLAQDFAADQFIISGPLASQPGGGFGFQPTWFSTGSSPGWIGSAGSLSATYLQPSLATRGGRALATTPGSKALRFLSSTYYRSGNIAWISFLLKQPDGGLASGLAGIELNSTLPDTYVFAGTYYGEFRLRLFSRDFRSNVFPYPSATSLVLLKVETNLNSTGTVSMWIDPDLSNPSFLAAPPQAIATNITFNNNGLYSIAMTSDTPGVAIDELRVAPDRYAVLPLADVARLWTLCEGGNGHAYLPVYAPTGISGSEAQADALARGGVLASITGALENQFVYDCVATRTELWGDTGVLFMHPGPLLGARSNAGTPGGPYDWHWLDATPWASALWAPGQPAGAEQSYFNSPYLRYQTKESYAGGTQEYFNSSLYWEVALSDGASYPNSTAYIIEFPDAFYERPADQDLVLGGTAHFHAAAAGAPGTYSWNFNGQPLFDGPTPFGSQVFGAHSADLYILNLSSFDAGEYSVSTDGFCEYGSAVAHLSSVPGAIATQWHCADGGNGHFYLPVQRSSGITWDAANAEAAATGGHLATIDGPSENDFVFGLASAFPALWPTDGLGNSIGPWLGAYKVFDDGIPTDGWYWVADPYFMFFSNWAPAEPDNSAPGESAVHFYGPGGPGGGMAPTWNDAPRNGPVNGVLPRGYIIEWDSPFTQGPSDVSIDCAQTASFDIHMAPVDLDSLYFVWFRNGQPLADGPTPWGSTIAGAFTSSLTISSATDQDQGTYTFQLWSDCLFYASSASLVVTGCAPPCPADFNQDGGIDGADVSSFFGAWENGDPSADVNQDGGVDGGDVGTFFAAWENGGC